MSHDVLGAVWIGLMDVRRLPGRDALDGAFGAWVTVAAGGVKISDAVTKLVKQASDLGLEAHAFDWLMPYDELPEGQRDNEVIAGLASAVARGGVAFSETFHCYPETDEPADLADGVSPAKP
jgi:hypothetical protein